MYKEVKNLISSLTENSFDLNVSLSNLSPPLFFSLDISNKLWIQCDAWVFLLFKNSENMPQNVIISFWSIAPW